MKKKKIMTIALALSVVSIIAAGGSLAYFTDKDQKENVFIVGNVDIELEEQFQQDSKLIPGGENMNLVEKMVDVKNAGSEDAYVRVHIGVPKAADPCIHLVKGKAPDSISYPWVWSDETYDVTYENKDYTVHMATYQRRMAEEGKTVIPAIEAVYMDSAVTNATISELKEYGAVADGKLDIKVMAEGVQAEGFGDAESAFAAAFGEISETNNPFTGYSK